MGKVRMLHPSSGRDNFNVVPNQATTNTGDDQSPQATIQNQDAARAASEQDIEEQTRNAIMAAAASHSQTSSNNSKANEKK
ncbi:unnamed protein product [Adineta steineri]|uniref:Uncharacterized protein n=1 Tax=Adineta steineri TaxID=433720 RepID=A0A819GG64_9BILA|nr:unnamed protein product [Adineta steineri]CAF1464340.1 unnamed protein product [Adineta steineri]CAF1489689.1 unnamed protein product [Adineta steineri]CAF3594646.1 unnamed protein product [Adineta steineri]CAF3879257.1 unnamed protein product [Adineta steineri]